MSITPFCQNVLFCHCWLVIVTKLTKRCERGKAFLCKIRISDNHESPQSPLVSALVSLDNSYISMVEQFHQLDYGRFGVLIVQVTNLSAEVFMVCNHIRLIRNRSFIGCLDISDATNFGWFLVHRWPKQTKMSVLPRFPGVMYHGSAFLGDITSFEIRTGSDPCPSKKIETPKECLRKFLVMRCPIKSGMTHCHYRLDR